MKKLFITGLSALMILGVASCGGKSYDETVLSGEKDGYTFHAVGGWGVWEATEANKMTATSVAAVAKLDSGLADKLAGKSLKYLYVAQIEIGKAEAGWTAKAKKDGKVVEIDGSFTLKCIRATYNKEESTYVNDQWVPNPADTSAAHMEALTDNLFVPAYQKEPDADGFSWADNPVVISAAGAYNFVVAQYTAASSETVVGFGFGLVPVALK